MSENNKDDIQPNYRFSVGGLQFTSEEAPYLIMGSPITDKEDIGKLQINISDSVKAYSKMYYTTSLEALGYILKRQTIRSSSLTYAKLNDLTEKERVGVTQFAASRFITCFSHIDHESVPFWMYYGGESKQTKILLKFKNIANDFCNAIHTDYCLVADGKKVFFKCKDYGRTINQNGIIGELVGAPKINADFDLRNCVGSIEMFDIEYLPVEHHTFSKDFSGKASVDFGASKNMTAAPSVLSNVDVFDPNCLGKQKSDAWETEGETRILCCLNIADFSEWDFIDLRLKEEAFNGLTIVLSPWLSPGLETEVRKILAESSISEDVKETITIEHSSLEGTINI